MALLTPPIKTFCLVSFGVFLFQTAAISQVPDLVFSTATDNGLYNAAVTSFGVNYDRFDSPLDAVNNAPNGSGVLILADGYPDARQSIQQQVLDVAAQKNLRLYIEYPDAVPGLSFGSIHNNSVDRLVVDSNSFFGTNLQQWDLLDAHESRFVNVSSNISDAAQHIRLAKVAGYDTAPFGYQSSFKRAVLFEHQNSGVDMLVATTQLSNFVTGRYMPQDHWQSAWSGVARLVG